MVVYDKNDQVGGNWLFSPEPSHSSVFETTHIITSKALSEYSDYPWPRGYSDYPGHSELLAYFQGYARRFGVDRHVRFRTEVKRAEPEAGGGFRVTLSTGESERFDHLLVANGHHWDPRMPSYPGGFAGSIIHSHDFKSSAAFKGQRVLVVGGGNSACDIAVETARVSSGDVPLYLRVFPPHLRDVYFIGLFQPIGCIWPLAELQAKLVANHIVGSYRLPADMERRIAREVETIRSTFVQTPRHTIEVDYHPFHQRLLRDMPPRAPEWPRDTSPGPPAVSA